MFKLYGDGIHDDTQAIQEMIDSGVCEISLPVPKKCYLISKPIELPSNFRLVLPRFAEIKLADNSNCVMLKNKTLTNRVKRTNDKFWDYINEYDPDFECKNIEVCGGIWNCNNLGQKANPLLFEKNLEGGYNGFGFLFYNVKNLIITNLTMKDPITFSINIDKTSYFTIENLIFDFNYGNPLATNMDGVHIDGNCHFGRITNLKGACYDDLVALNADEGSNGPITNIDISGIYAEDCHSALRLLTVNNPIEHIHISDVHGTYFQYCIGITKFFDGETKGYYDGVTIDNVYASKAERLPVYNKSPDAYVYPLIYIEDEHNVRNLKISELHRREYINTVETIYVGKDTDVENLILENITTQNYTHSSDMPLLVNKGTIKHLSAANIYADDKTINL